MKQIRRQNKQMSLTGYSVGQYKFASAVTDHKYKNYCELFKYLCYTALYEYDLTNLICVTFRCILFKFV